MNFIWELLAMLVVLGIGWLLCHDGYQAIKTKKTRVKTSKVTGGWAQFVGVLLLVIGLPLMMMGAAVAVMMIGSLLK